MQVISAYIVPSRLLTVELLSASSGYPLDFFFEIFNFFTLSIVTSSALFMFVLRRFYRSVDTSSDTVLTVYAMSVVTAAFILVITELLATNPSFFNLENNSIAHSSRSFADIVFISLFLLITPLTLTLLAREERFSFFFCVLNFMFLFIVVIFLSTTSNILGLVMAYELVFIPSFFIMRRTIYSSAALSAYSVFTVWSVLGSLVVVGGAICLVAILGYNAVSIVVNPEIISSKDLTIISILFFVGFGVKIPVWPFHY